MIKHYLKTTFRYLQENKMASAINLVGLATALCVVYFALLYVHFELSYDKFNKNVNQVYRVGMNLKKPGMMPSVKRVPHLAMTVSILKNLLKSLATSKSR